MNIHSLPAVVRALVDAGRAAPSADNSQPWLFRWDGRYLDIKYDRQRVHGKTFGPEEHPTLIAMGATGENIVQMASYLNVSVHQLGREEAKDYFRFEVQTLEATPEAMPEDRHPLYQRHTNRWPFASNPIPNNILDGLEGFSQGRCRVLVVNDRAQIRKIAGWVRTASEARFQSPDLHELFAKSLRFTAEEASQGDGLDVRTLPLPPGGRLVLRLMKDWERMRLLNRFRGYKIFAASEASAISNSANLMIIVGPNGWDNSLDAGMLMESTWIYLNSRGIAVQPYYVITDQLQRLSQSRIDSRLRSSIDALASDVEAFLGSTSETIHMLLRIGYPKKQPIRSFRLPSEKITDCTDEPTVRSQA